MACLAVCGLGLKVKNDYARKLPVPVEVLVCSFRVLSFVVAAGSPAVWLTCESASITSRPWVRSLMTREESRVFD